MERYRLENHLEAYQRSLAHTGSGEELGFRQEYSVVPTKRKKCFREKEVVYCAKSCFKFQGGAKLIGTIGLSGIKVIEELYENCLRNFM